METQHYTIGTFASMNKVSTCMLRHYDKIGLLQPDHLLPNGYRCYTEEQIATISSIKQLRDCGFLLDEIVSILQNNNFGFLEKEAQRKLTQLHSTAVHHQSTINSLHNLITEKNSDHLLNSYGVSLTTRGETILLVPKELYTIDEIEPAFDHFFRYLHTKKLPTIGCAVLRTPLDYQEEQQIQLGAPLLEPYHDEFYQTISLSATPTLSVIHYGDYYHIGHAYRALLSYANQSAYAISNTIMERYFIDRSHGVSVHDYVTEISIALHDSSSLEDATSIIKGKI